MITFFPPSAERAPPFISFALRISLALLILSWATLESTVDFLTTAEEGLTLGLAELWMAFLRIASVSALAFDFSLAFFMAAALGFTT